MYRHHRSQARRSVPEETVRRVLHPRRAKRQPMRSPCETPNAPSSPRADDGVGHRGGVVFGQDVSAAVDGSQGACRSVARRGRVRWSGTGLGRPTPPVRAAAASPGSWSAIEAVSSAWSAATWRVRLQRSCHACSRRSIRPIPSKGRTARGGCAASPRVSPTDLMASAEQPLVPRPRRAAAALQPPSADWRRRARTPAQSTLAQQAPRRHGVRAGDHAHDVGRALHPLVVEYDIG